MTRAICCAGGMVQWPAAVLGLYFAMASGGLHGCAETEQEADVVELPEADPGFPGLEWSAENLPTITCVYSATTRKMTITLASGDYCVVFKSYSTTAILVNGRKCTDGGTNTADTSNTTQIAVNGDNVGSETLVMDYTRGFFVMGTASLVGLDVNLMGGATDKLGFRMTTGNDTVVFGATGINLNNDSANDVTYSAIERFTVSLGPGNDSFAGNGSTQTGAAFGSTGLQVDTRGGDGNDYLRGGLSGDTLYGDAGDDVGGCYGSAATTCSSATDGSDLGDGGAGTADELNFTQRTLTVFAGAGVFGEAGESKTGTGVEIIKSGSGSDTLDGTGSPTGFTGYGYDGNDSMASGNGNDTIYGGNGNDTLDESGVAANGADWLYGEGGTDWVVYDNRTGALTITIDNNANDGASGELDNVRTDVENLIGGTVADSIYGSSSDNTLFGVAGNDTLSGADGNDYINSGMGNDRAYGDGGDDILFEEGGYSSNDTYYGGTGQDRVSYARGVNLFIYMDGTTASGDVGGGETDIINTDVEDVDVSAGVGNNTITGNASDNTITGGGTQDTIYGGGGSDILDGGAGANDRCQGDADFDICTNCEAVITCEG